LADSGTRLATHNGLRGEYKGHEILCAVGGGTHLAMLANPQFLARSVGFVGVSDGWQQLRNHRRLTDQYDTANDGNVALSAELAMGADGASVLAVGFGRGSRRLTPRVSASASTQSAQG
jgi:glucoamylase